MRKNVEELESTDNNLVLCVACWVTKATDIHSEYVILSTFPWQ